MKKVKYSLLVIILCISQFLFAQSENTVQLFANNISNIEPTAKSQTESLDTLNAQAKPKDTVKTKWNIDFEVSLTSRFIWRGLELGDYPSIQPNVTFSKGNFFIGAWASHSLTPSETVDGNITGYKEVIPYIGYGFKTGRNSKFVIMVLDH